MLHVTGLLKAYSGPAGSAPVVDVPEFRIEAGAQVALRGESGSGKTTFLNLIAGILRADAGSIRVGGVDMAALSEAGRDRLRADRIGYMFQTFNLLQGHTVLENVLLGMAFGPRRPDRARAGALLGGLGLGDRLGHFPRQLSVGQQQRVALARALANAPALVLADEPTGNLDRRNAALAVDTLRAACRDAGAALVLVSHDEGVLASFEDRREFGAVNRAAAGKGGRP